MKMNRNTLVHRSWLASLVLLLAACVNNDFNDLPQPPAGNAVSFRTETMDDFATRAAGHTTTGTYAIRSMGIYAAYTSDAWDGTAASNNFFDNLPVSRSNDSSPWSYGNEQLWPGSGYLTFFAYAPHSDNAAYGVNKPVINTPSAGTPTLQYTIAPTHDNQVDLLVATPVKDQTKRDYVTIPLRHALTKIAFSARLANPASANEDIRITEISLSKLNSRGTILMDGSNRQWTGLSTPATYTQTNAPAGGLRSLPLTDTYQPLTPTDGHLFLMPQKILYSAGVDSVGVTIKYTTTVNGVPDSGKEYTLALGRAITEFHPGMAYNLMITIDNGISFIVAPTKWDNTDVQADIKNRILNVTRIEANVYPGVATRIYFWSNQPRDSVYVRKDGNIDSSKYPTGTKYIVNDAFQNLSEKSATNLHYYPGFDGVTTTSGEGYIDVLIKDNAADPYLPVLVDGDKRHIWLNASGLTRNILLNSVVKGNPTTTPYIGTFHRWNETGERIITWSSNSSTWTAQVIEQPQGTEILLDRLPSPFMANGQLYGDPGKEVGDPETAQLAPTSTTSVSGTGRVYFRVGIKHRLANRGSAPRYGRIKVSGTNIALVNNETVNEMIIYVRQGEADDYVMLPTDAITGTGGSTSRPNAVKWSPYNLTAKGLTDGKELEQITADRANATFVKYPTQAGAFFQWSSITNPRYAYHPVIPLGKPAGWEDIASTQLWKHEMSQNESCPPGYRRPADGSITEYTDHWNVSDSEFRHSLFETIMTTTNLTNSTWGYYADGFFDRHRITDISSSGSTAEKRAVKATSVNVGYLGRLYYRTTHPSNSLFFPAAGSRHLGKLSYAGDKGEYWSSSKPNMIDNPLPKISDKIVSFLYLISWSNAMLKSLDDNSSSEGNTIRCVRDIGFSTTLPPYGETGVPTVLGFDANAGASPIDVIFISKWNTTMARDFRLYTEEDAAGNTVIRKIAAKVTFRGTTATGGHTVNTDVFATALGKVGSSVTYDFKHTGLTWTAGTSFTYYVLDGWTAKSYIGSSTTAATTVVGWKDSPLPIVLSQKGRIVFTRTTAPVAP